MGISRDSQAGLESLKLQHENWFILDNADYKNILNDEIYRSADKYIYIDGNDLMSLTTKKLLLLLSSRC